MKYIFLLIQLLLLLQLAEAADNHLTFEPIYGVETALVRFPEPQKYVTRATYGARVLYGTIPLSGELEYTEARSRNDYGSTQTVEDVSKRLGLGLRTTIPLGSTISIYGRAGARASKGETKVTTNGVTDNHPNPFQFDPYAGAGLQFSFASLMSLNAGVTMIRNDQDHYDAQYTLGLNARFGSSTY